MKNTFTQYLKDKLEVVEVQGPILSKVGDGMQDNLSGCRKSSICQGFAEFHETYEVVHSLAKWKRHTLARFGFGEGEGLFVHMKALRPDERFARRDPLSLCGSSGTGRRLSQMVNAISPISKKLLRRFTRLFV